MDKKTSTLLWTAKYGGYFISLWIIINFGVISTAVLSTFMLAFALDSIRNFYLESRSKPLALYSLYLQLALTVLFTLLDKSGIAVVLYIIIITESFISFPRRVGDLIFFLSFLGFTASSMYIGIMRGDPVLEVLSVSFVNSMVLVFAYGISYMAKRQFEEKERAEETLEKLEASRQELELAHQQLLNHSKQRERLVLIEERNRMAREIHDTLAHSLTSIIVGMEAARKLLDKDIGRARIELEKSQEQARHGLDDVRRSVKALRPRALAEQGFSDALRGLSRGYGEQGVLVTLRMEGDLEVPKNYELPLFRVIQECLTNSVRHSKASRVFVTLTAGEDSLHLEVRDDGPGCQELSEGGGLQGIRERLEAIGGYVEFFPRGQDGNSGFMVKATIKEGAA